MNDWTFGWLEGTVIFHLQKAGMKKRDHTLDNIVHKN